MVVYRFSCSIFWDYMNLLSKETEHWLRFLSEQSEFSLVLPKSVSD